jgi:hypothetical protein
MKKNIFLFCLLICCQFIKAQNISDELWSIGTARTMFPGRLETGIFNPAQYGLSQKTELHSYLTSFPINPNLGIKHFWLTLPFDVMFSSRHAVYLPSPALKMAKNMDLDSNLTNSGNIPMMFGFTNELLFSKYLVPKTSCAGADKLLTLKLGVKKAFGAGSSELNPILKPVIYQQTSPFRDTLLWYVGLDLDAHFSRKLDYSVDLEFQSCGFQVYHYEIEHKGMLIWKLNEHFRLVGGYKAGFGTYSDKNRFFIYPFADVLFSFTVKSNSDIKQQKPYKFKKKKVKKERGLFEKGTI